MFSGNIHYLKANSSLMLVICENSNTSIDLWKVTVRFELLYKVSEYLIYNLAGSLTGSIIASLYAQHSSYFGQHPCFSLRSDAGDWMLDVLMSIFMISVLYISEGTSSWHNRTCTHCQSLLWQWSSRNELEGRQRGRTDASIDKNVDNL